MMDFLEQEHSWEEYCEKILDFEEMKRNVNANIEKNLNTGLFNITRQGLLDGMNVTIQIIIDNLLDQNTITFRKECKK